MEREGGRERERKGERVFCKLKQAAGDPEAWPGLHTRANVPSPDCSGAAVRPADNALRD